MREIDDLPLTIVSPYQFSAGLDNAIDRATGRLGLSCGSWAGQR
jgi:hypothetical protein